jgi:hypothetical protein
MKHQLPRFSVPMPGAKVEWPLERARTGIRVECSACGAVPMGEKTSDGTKPTPHVHAADVDRPRKRICFG